jgi:hypothetical protein
MFRRPSTSWRNGRTGDGVLSHAPLCPSRSGRVNGRELPLCREVRNPRSTEVPDP